MKISNFYSALIFSILFIPAFVMAQEPNLDIVGTANGTKLIDIFATDMSINADIIEISAPTSPASTTGQFIECQIGTGLGLGTLRAQINYDGSAFFASQVNVAGNILLEDDGLNSSSEILMEDTDGNQTISIRTKDSGSAVGGEIILQGGDPLATTIEIDGNWAGTGQGRIRTDELEIEGGSDIAENFDVFSSLDMDVPLAGLIVSIDPERPGKLIITETAYDNKVAGIISGANGVNTGLYMGQKDSEADGEFPVALAGRVYVWADASYGSIKPGDMLTTSPTLGHAMKVKKLRKAQGSVVGKAMTGLENGKGYVLVLVNLQ